MVIPSLTTQWVGNRMVWLDCFMSRRVFADYSPTVTTRSNEDNNNFIMEVYAVSD